jgi:hypothetical protein
MMPKLKAKAVPGNNTGNIRAAIGKTVRLYHIYLP